MDSIDASVGLGLTLQLLEQYHRRGILRAAISRVPDRAYFSTWSPRQKQMLYLIYSLIDGRHTVNDIEMSATLPVHIVQKILVILTKMKIIVIMT